jgi:adenosyl cobinamide kinase/adenosyl cobinamide phosphate guanylyltransferase
VIYLVTGPPGAGKSYFCVRTAAEALDKGLYLGTNVELHEGWHHELARSNHFRRLVPGRVAKKAAEFLEHSYVTHSLEELLLLRLPPCKRCPNCRRGGRCQKENRGVMLLDEAHMWLNARTWDADETGQQVSKAQAIQNRLAIVRFFSQHRKLGWKVYLVTQDAAQLDAQVRRNFEYHVHLKNIKNFRLPVLGIPLVPVNMFTAITTWHDAEQSKIGVKAYRLNRRIANLYDTTATSHGLDYDHPDAIWLGGSKPASSKAREVEPERGQPASVADVACLTSWAGGVPLVQIGCPRCRVVIPVVTDGLTSTAPVGHDGRLALRCPRCKRYSVLRAPTPKLVVAR